MDPHTHPLTLSIVVKAATPEQANQYAMGRMNEWFNDSRLDRMIKGYGCPNGSLMLWRIVEKDNANAT